MVTNNICHITFSTNGGAGSVARQLHEGQLSEGNQSRLITLTDSNIRSLVAKNPILVSEALLDFFCVRKTTQSQLFTLYRNGENSGIAKSVQHGDDLVHLHWTPGVLSLETISQLARSGRGCVWTLHDMWPFCGGEHYTPDDEHARFVSGYLPNNRPSTEKGPDLNRLAWEAKRIAWQSQRFAFVCPSDWMADCVRKSALFRDTAVTTHVVANPLDTDQLWQPIDKKFARLQLGLDPNRQYVLAGSAGGMSKNKGEDLLPEIMRRLQSMSDKPIDLIVFGRYRAMSNERWDGKVHWMGPVHDDSVMATIYSATDVMIVPSRQDNLPNTAVEALACGTPVAAFNLGGLPDIVDHERTGWLAQPEDLTDLTQGIIWLLGDRERHSALCRQSRQSAVLKFSPSQVVKQYLAVYESVAKSAI